MKSLELKMLRHYGIALAVVPSLLIAGCGSQKPGSLQSMQPVAKAPQNELNAPGMKAQYAETDPLPPTSQGGPQAPNSGGQPPAPGTPATPGHPQNPANPATPGTPPGHPGSPPVAPAPGTPPGANPGAPTNPNTPPAGPAPTYKYPAAVVIENGAGNAAEPDAGQGLKPKWRLYLCLQPTDIATQGKVNVDFGRLRSPIFKRYYEETGARRLLRVERLDEVTLNYEYEAHEASEPNASMGTLAAFTGTSKQSWTPISHLRHYHPPAHSAATDDLGLFNKGIQNVPMVEGESKHALDAYTYQEQDGSTHYLTSEFQLASGLPHGIEECERSNESQFFIIGLDGPNPMNVTSP